MAARPFHPIFTTRKALMDQLACEPDLDGRPSVAEALAPRDVTSAFEWRECPYPDSRKGKRMNLSALKQMVGHWDEILAGVAYVRSAHLQTTSAKEPSALDAIQVASAVTFAALYLHLRGEGPLPGQVTAMNKAYSDVDSVLKMMLLEAAFGGGTRGLLRRGLAAADLVTYAEERDLFVREGNACAGPTPLIEKAIDLLLRGDPAATTGADAWRSRLGDVDLFLSAAHETQVLDLVSLIYPLQCRAVLLRLEDALRAEGATPPGALEEAHRRLAERGEDALFQLHPDAAACESLALGVKELLEEISTHQPQHHHPAVLALVEPPPPALVDRVTGFAAATPLPARPLVAALLQDAAQEQQLLWRYRAAGERLARCLPVAADPLTGATLQEAVGQTPLGAAASLLGLTVELDEARLRLTQGGRTMVLSRAPGAPPYEWTP